MVSSKKRWIKNKKTNKIYWLDNSSSVKGEWIFTFDKKKEFNMFSDYPDKLTAEEKKIFDKENPFWKDFFKDRQ